MAQKVLVELVDDMDGTHGDDVTTVGFGLDGVQYEIDLNNDNAEQLRDALAEFVAVARRTGGRMKRGTRPSSAQNGSSGDAAKIRAWAADNGFELSGRGRIPGHVVDAYHEAQQNAQREAEAKSARKKPARATSATGRGRARATSR